jgi:hypothetical protein
VSEPGATPGVRPGALAALRAPFAQRGFAGLFWGQLVSITGDRFHYLALVALLSAHAARHGAPPTALLAALAWAMVLPTLLFSTWAGALVDRAPLVRVLVTTDAARSLVVAVLPFAYLAWPTPFAVFAVVFVVFSLNAFFLPARSALPPRIAPGPALDSANAILVLAGVVATLVGTALGGPVVDRLGPSVALWIDAATYAASAVLLSTLFFVDLAPRPPAAARTAGTTALAHTFAEARDGWRALVKSRVATAAVLAAVATWVAGGVLHVAGTAHVLKGGTHVAGLGALLGCLGVGAALGSAWTLARPPRARTRAMAQALLGAGAGLAVFALVTPPWAMALSALATGACAAPVFFLSESAVQEAVPEAARARAFSARDFVARLAFLGATALTAPVALRFGTTVPLVGAGVTLALLAWLVLAWGGEAAQPNSGTPGPRSSASAA